MYRPLFFRFRITFLILAGLFIIIVGLIPVCSAEISIGTIIDTVGMVDDHTTIAMGTGIAGNGSSMLYRDSSLSNGGAFQMNKVVGTGSSGSAGSIDAQKVLRYTTAGTGSHLSLSEGSLTSTAGTKDTKSTPVCSFASGPGDGNRSTSASASLEIINANTLDLATSTRITPGDLQNSVTANTSLASGNYSGPATIKSSFTSTDQTAHEITRATDRSMVSGLFDLFTRAYHGGDGATIQAQTRASGMVSSKTIAEHTYGLENSTGIRPEWRGSTVYAADVMTNGGDLDETRRLISDETIRSQRVLTYQANGPQSMQSEERIVAVKEAPLGNGSATVTGCVLSQGEQNNTTRALYQSVAASSQIFGVDSAQISSTARVDIGSGKNGTLPLKVEYHADIISPIQFDAKIVQVMTDPDNDGRYEDLNGNKKQDMQDLVLLFRNFEWLSKSSLSPRFDYNNNGRVDLADLTRAFKDVQV